MTPSPWSIPRQHYLEELWEYALSLIKVDRAGTRTIAYRECWERIRRLQMHAQDMLEHDYFGHWWFNGMKPYMVYSVDRMVQATRQKTQRLKATGRSEGGVNRSAIPSWWRSFTTG